MYFSLLFFQQYLCNNPSRVLGPFGGSLQSCCGVSWLLTSPAVSPALTPAGVTCNGTSLGNPQAQAGWALTSRILTVVPCDCGPPRLLTQPDWKPEGTEGLSE